MSNFVRKMIAPFLLLLAFSFSIIVLPSQSKGACNTATSFTYNFTNYCSYPVWIGQRSTGDPASHPPQGGNWALAAMCKTNTDCISGRCDNDSGQCSCANASQCTGGAQCLANGKCSVSAQFCMPKNWDSGTFWPRTGCVLNKSVKPATLTCKTGGCFDTANTGRQLLDCSVENRGGSPKNPATQFEVTSTPTSLNYDVSIAAGFNVETIARPIGGGWVAPGTTNIVACFPAGCTGDLNASCPVALRVSDHNKVIGCLDPCTQCQQKPGSLQCKSTFPGKSYTDCKGHTGPVTYQDMYCAKNMTDGNAQASSNQGTPTSFGAKDCAPGTSFVRPTFKSSYKLPAGQGVCLYTKPPQSNIPHFNDRGWADYATNTYKNCGGVAPSYKALSDGTPCGGYLTIQKDNAGKMGYYKGALGYTCQTATYKNSAGNTQTAHLCMPPIKSGLGTCQTATTGTLPLYNAVGGVSNPAWLTAGIIAGGGSVPYYTTFKNACPSAYTWQYDDDDSGFSCDATKKTTGGSAFSGFNVTFCGSSKSSHGTVTSALHPSYVVALDAKGRVRNVGSGETDGLVKITGRFKLPDGLAPGGPVFEYGNAIPTNVMRLDRAVFILGNIIDESGAAGELTMTYDKKGISRLKLTALPGSRPDMAVFATPDDARPSVYMKIEVDNALNNRMTFDLTVEGIRIATPVNCSKTAGAQTTRVCKTHLETSFILQTDSGPDLQIGALLPWNYSGRELHR